MYILARQTFELKGVFTAPPSKSETIRALFFALLTPGISTVHPCLDAEDVRDAMGVCVKLGSVLMGANMRPYNETIQISSNGPPFETPDRLYTGHSGITTRFILPILGLRKAYDKPIIVDCGEQMRARPMRGLFKVLRQLGLNITYLQEPDAFPISLSGRIQGGNITINEPISQYLSALLIALPLAQEDSIVIMKHDGAQSYVNLTRAYLDQQNIQYRHERIDGFDHYFIKGKQQYHACAHFISGDYSNASYIMAASAMLPGKITLHGLNNQSQQGDKKIVEILEKMGADIKLEDHHICITGGKPLIGIDIDAQDIPDLLPTLAVLGTYCSGKTIIRNVSQARLKETDRIHSMREGLSRMGAHIEEMQDGLVIHSSSLRGATLNGYNDHRTVMALTLAGMFAEGETRITDARAIHKTFPSFIECLQKLGGQIEVCHG